MTAPIVFQMSRNPIPFLLSRGGRSGDGTPEGRLIAKEWNVQGQLWERLAEASKED